MSHQACDQALSIDSQNALCLVQQRHCARYSANTMRPSSLSIRLSALILSLPSWYNKGTALGSPGKYDEAIKACDQAISLTSVTETGTIKGMRSMT